MKSNIHYFLLILGLLTVHTNCQKSDLPKLLVEYDNGLLTCDDCTRFGQIVALKDDNLWVADLWNVFWFISKGATWDLQQIIHFDNSASISNFEIQGNTLLVSLRKTEGVGEVRIFEKTGGQWIATQKLRSGKPRDDFGSSLAIDGNHFIIGGTKAPFPDTSSVYFYYKVAGLWKLSGSFQALDPIPNGRFGQAVAIHGNYAYVGSVTTDGLYIYYYDGHKWSLRERWLDVRFGRVRGLSVDGNRLMIKNHYVNGQSINIFQIQEGAPIQSFGVEFDFNSGMNTPADHGRLIQLSGDFAAVSMEHTEKEATGEVILLQLVDGSWKVKNRYGPVEGSSPRFAYGFDFTEHWIAMGDDFYNMQKGVVILRSREW